jgi:hypothetical protein
MQLQARKHYEYMSGASGPLRWAPPEIFPGGDRSLFQRREGDRKLLL